MQISIKKVLTTTLALVLALLAGLLTYAVIRFYTDSTYETLSKANTERLQLVSQKADALATGADAVARLLYQDLDISGTILSSDITLQNIPNVSANIDLLCAKYYSAFQQFGLSFDVVCFGENGFRYSSCDYSEKDFELLSSYSWFKKQRAYRNIAYTVANFVPIPDSGDNMYCYAIVRNIYEVSGEYAGSIIVFVPEHVLALIYEDLLSDESTFYLLNEYSTVISSNDKSQIGTSPETIHDYLFVRSNDYYDTYINSYGVESFCVKYTSPITSWTIFEQIPLGTVMQPVRATAFKIIAIALCLYLLSLSVISIVSNSIAKPIRAICSEMERSIRKHFTHLQIQSRLSEIRSIGASYDHLCDEINELLKNIRAAEKQANDAKFNFLKAQINPHFLYNTLFSIKCTVALNEPEHACEMLTLLIALLKNSVSSNESNTTLLESTIEIEQYAQLQNLRYNNKVHCRFNLPQELMQLKIPRFLIQPLVENVFLHAVRLSDEIVDLLIRFRIVGEKLLVEICDTGVGFTQEGLEQVLMQQHPDESSHIGLRNIQERVQLLYGRDYSLSVTNDEHFHTIITLSLPRQEGDHSIVPYFGS